METAQDRTVVLTSHDQDFLDSVTLETMYLRKQNLRYFEGYVILSFTILEVQA